MTLNLQPGRPCRVRWSDWLGITVNNTKTMRNERLGEIAYNAYCAARGWKSVLGEPLPHWQQQDDTLRAAWCDAADAVAKEISIQTGRG